jgi:uncharacterized protein (DUF1330 family)
MSVYLIMDIEITDEESYAEYRSLVPPIIEKFGGTYLARGGWAKNVEGDWQPNRIVMLEFESSEVAEAFLNSSEYEPIKCIRHSASNSRGILVEAFDASR